MGILTVITPAANQLLTTTATVKTVLDISGSSEDAKLDIFIKQASAAIAKHCKRVFLSETVTELYRRNPDDAVRGACRPATPLVLTRYPVSSVTSVAEDDAVLATSAYELDGQAGLLTRLCDDAIVAWSDQKTLVQYVAGYDSLAKIPDVEEACILLVSHKRSSANRDRTIKAVEVVDIDRVEYWVGGTSGDDPSGFPPEVSGLLTNYVRRFLG